MTRLPIRVKLMAAFASAMLLMLTTTALFVYVRLRDDFDDRVDASLHAHLDAAISAHDEGARLAGVALEDPEETLVQVLSPTGRVIETAGQLQGPALTRDEGRAALQGDVVAERRLPGIDGKARILARSSGDGEARVIIVIGQSLVDRNDALDSVVTSFALGSAAAVVVASAIGYALAKAGLAPVEAMRRRAHHISLSDPDGGLPLPRAHDEVRRLGETLNDMLSRLRASFERESRFVADASHELRTPIAVIKTELESALRSGGYGPDVHESLLAAASECDRLARLADDLLVLARAGDGQLPVRLESFPVAELLEAVRGPFVQGAAQAGRYIEVDCDAGQRVTADPARLRQVLVNLLDNALRHGAGDVTIRSRIDGGGTTIAVSDGGRGFSPELAAKAFDRFTRGDPARSGSGAGLGLAIVRTIVDAHGGRVTIVAGHSTTVQLSIPAPDTP